MACVIKFKKIIKTLTADYFYAYNAKKAGEFAYFFQYFMPPTLH
ncbi:hypothetical protein PTRA_a0804 [Pseudoalteromonas translucida KMM 520]|uniref:Uncharacterized protein n=1 Tax=Pseudoalteromonas translucida KMM 520 TaxID=1315283 RepID=A0A0U2X054_9GAMM|nr:hypothetical protein PTRA_a0804 [Pseudoalteromonas translucida KMM 520]